MPACWLVSAAGFSRYVVYGWGEHELYVLESTEVNNATYVLKKNWEAVSGMTKAQVLDEGMYHVPIGASRHLVENYRRPNAE